MFDSGNLPSPLSDPSGGPSAGGDSMTIVSVVAEIVPVRVVNSNGIKVEVLNWPGKPPPLPDGGLRVPGLPPSLPGIMRNKPKDGGGLSAGDLGLGRIAELGTVAGVAAAGVGLIASGAKELIGTFIDPIVGAAKGGFGRGLERGMGTEVLGKAFEVMGVAIGVHFLPMIIKVGAAALTLAEKFEQVADSPLWDVMNRLAMGPLGGVGGKDDGIITKFQKAREWGINAIEKYGGIGGPMYGKYVDKTGLRPDVKKTQEQEKDANREMLLGLRETLGGKSQFIGVADIRAQAQMAAAIDPFEKMIRKKLNDYLDKELGVGPTELPPWAKEFMRRMFPFGNG